MEMQNYDPLKALDEACYNYRVSTFGMMKPDDESITRFRKAAVEYKKAMKNVQKYLRNELKMLEKEVDYYDNQRTVN